MPSVTQSHRAVDLATSALFLLALCAPAVDQLVRPDEARDTSEHELRPPEPRPGWPRGLADVSSFPRRHEAHFDDTFGLRDVLLRWRALQYWFALDTSPSPVLDKGRTGWTYYRGESSREVHRGVQPFAAGELDEWVASLRERRDLAAQQGARYLFLICPNKETIYPERAPASWDPVGPTRLDQLVERLARAGDVPFLDLRPVLRAARARDAEDDWAYTEHGTHWHGRGAWAGYRAILERLQGDFPGLAGVTLEDCRPVESEFRENLARQMYLEHELPQRHYTLEPPRTSEVLHPSIHAEGARLVTRQAIEAPRLLWFHDSFGPYLQGAMCETFAHVDARWTPAFDPEALFEARPDVVLETYVERVLVATRPWRRPVDLRSPAERFEAATDVAWRDPPDDEARAARPEGRALVERRPEGLHLEVPGLREGLELPELVLGPGEEALLRVEVAAPAPVDLGVFVRVGGELAPDRMRLELGPRTPSVVFRLPVDEGAFQVLLRVIPPARSVDLRGLEIRRAAR